MDGTMSLRSPVKDITSRFDQQQSRLIPLAYNVLGDMNEARDVVQELLSHYFLNPTDHIENHDAYLTRSVINRAINAKKKIKVRRESYNGMWLPTPVGTEDDVYRSVDKRYILNYSLLVLLERLTPRERAVFILKESFDYQHSDIAAVLELREDYCRQLFRRARKKLDTSRTVELKRETKNETVVALTHAILQGDIEKVKQLLAADVNSMSDGGSLRAARNILVGRDRVGRFLTALYNKYFIPGSEVVHTTINYLPALVFRANRIIYRCVVFEIHDEKIENVFIVINPEKLTEIHI